MRILLTGASGFVGAMLAPRLLEEGHDVRALTRDPARASLVLGSTSVELRRGDVLTGDGLAGALRRVDVAYYLIHSMESPPHGVSFAQPFPERERLGATNFARAARRAGVERIVYLGGLLPRERTPAPSPHLASRETVERVLLEYVPRSVALRSAIVIGARSRSFRLLVRLIERMPVLALPPWRRFRTQPIDARDTVEMLLAAATASDVAGLTLEIGGPEGLTYEELLHRIADALLLERPTFSIAFSATPIAARIAAALSQDDPELVLALMEGLRSDLLPANDRAAELLGVELHTLDAAIECALREWEAVEPLAAR